jgi:PAS domain-containing protein
VTEQVEREQALAAREDRLRLTLENVTDIVLDMAPDNTYRWVSSSVTRVLGGHRLKWSASPLSSLSIRTTSRRS